jgi:hypothetical protein
MLCLYHLPSITALSHFRSPHAWLSTSFLFSSIASRFSNVFQPSHVFPNPLAMNGISLHSVSHLWQCVASLSITFSISGNRGISFHNVFGLWQCFITFPALSGNVTPRFRSLAVLHNVSSSLWQCYITFLTSGNAWLCPR